MEKTLAEIVDFLKSNPVKLTTSNDDGRVNSIHNEHQIIDVLSQEFKGSVVKAKKREWFDFKIINNLSNLYVNVKITDMSNGAADNLSSKKGMGYALTGEENVADSWKKFNMNIYNNLKTGFDYYFLVVNKNNTKDVFWSSLKRINKLQSNGNNLPFQCNWALNRVPSDRNEREAIKYILSVYMESWDKKIVGYPSRLKKMLQNDELMISET